MDIYKKSEPVVLDAVQEADGVFRVPPIVERVEWKAHYKGFTFDDNIFDDLLFKLVREQMIKDLQRITKDFWRYTSS